MGFFLLTMAIVFELLICLPAAPQRFLSLLFFVPCLLSMLWKLIQRKKPSDDQILHVLIFALFLCYRFLKNESTLFYDGLARISGSFSALIGRLIGRPIDMGMTYSGLDVLVFFLIVYLCSLFYSRQRSWHTYIIYPAAALLLWGLYIALWTSMAESSLNLGLNLLEPLTGPLNYQFLLFAFLAALYMLLRRRHCAPANDRPLGLPLKMMPLLFLALAALITVPSRITASATPQNTGGRIIFWDSGIDFSVPQRGVYGLDRVGMFGVLPHYLSKQGYSCLVTKNLDAETLAEADLLVVLNPLSTPEDRTLDAVWSFIDQGGSLLAVGDHTGDEQVRLPLNALMQPVGIELNFDSAIPFRNLWADDFRSRNSPIFSGVRDTQFQIVVGASLNIMGTKAKPLILGQSGYSDLGDMLNTSDGYLGDMRFSRGERVGDLVLAAEAAYGKGKIMAFGDTTHFQNTILPYSYPFIDNIFAYLCSGNLRSDQSFEDRYPSSLLIESSHLEIISRDKSGDSLDGLIACALRADYLPFLNQHQSLSEALTADENIRLILINEPAQDFADEELHSLQQFMETGGHIILCAGYESPQASHSLAAHFGFSFEPIPIGRVAPDRNAEMAFWNACPLLYEGDNPIENDAVESLMEVWGFSTMAYRPIGSGGLYLFADPDFLKNKNLESVDTYREGNIRFIDSILTEIASQAKQRGG